jgi:hypothetical protein
MASPSRLEPPQNNRVDTKHAQNGQVKSHGVICRVSSRYIAIIPIAILFVLGLTVNLESVPPVWWDEGWTLSVARNWVEQGHYGQMLNGKPMPPGLSAAFPAAGSVALVFKYLGIGLFQARLVFVGYSLATVALLFYFACRLYHWRIAVATLLVLLLILGQADTHFLIVGREVLGELPALFFLIAGFILFLWAGERKFVYSLGAILAWSLALITKAQVAPFWLASMSLSCLMALFQRRWKSCRLFFLALVGAPLLAFYWQFLISQKLVPTSTSVSGLYQAVALVFVEPVRLSVSMVTLQIGLPTALGFAWMIRELMINRIDMKSHLDGVRLAYVILAGSWFAWFVLASVGIPRHMFPPVFLGSIFVARMLDDWTCGFNMRLSLNNAASVLTRLRFDRQKLYMLAAVLLIAWSLSQSIATLVIAHGVTADDSVMEAADYLNSETPIDARIETYESELFFLLKRQVHYPPDQIHVELIRRSVLGPQVAIDYNPLAQDPDYLVVGFINSHWRLYDRYLTEDNFELVKLFKRYAIYKRIRRADRP